MGRLARGVVIFVAGFAAATVLVSHCGQERSTSSSAPSLEVAHTAAQVTSEVDSAALRRQWQITASRENAITKAVAKASPAVVGINVIQVREYQRGGLFMDDPFWDFFYPRRYRERVQSLGSGFIISPDGYIVTNEHVVHNAVEIVVTLWGGKQYKAQVVGSDFVTDIALLKIDGKDLPTVTLGDSDDVIRGEWVIALGNPFGLFNINSEPSVNVGVVSNVNMDFGEQNGRVYQDMIQTDAQINGGNSGGPLLNSLGEVIGMNTWIISGSRDMSGNIGIGFAIPVNTIKRIVRELRDKGRVEREFWTGLEVDEMSHMVAFALGLGARRGVVVTDVANNSPGERAGLKPGDVILEVNGKAVRTPDQIMSLISEQDLRPGDKLRLKVYRQGRTFDAEVRLERPPR
ncbi:MAG: trypsin-like peptidase domain-containing protein [candidate division KSB1 bacterium]|jgi:serine protease Do|nr:trypsin-like peptidase domain-containing protein [candidate division KSB1 bacterium]